MESKSRTKHSIKNIFFGVSNRIISIVFQFVIKTIIIWTIGVKYLGLNSLFNSILVMLSLSEIGIGSALVYNMYKPLAENDTKKVSALLNTYKNCYRIIGIIIVIIGLIILPFLKLFINGEIPPEVNIYVLFLIYLVNTSSSYFLFAYKNALLEATQNNGIENNIKSIVNIFMYILQIIILISTKNYYLYIIILPISTILINLIRSRIVDKMYPQYKACGKLDKDEIKLIFHKVGALFGHKVGTNIITSADSIVISAILGLEILAVYSNYYLIVSSLITIVSIFYTSITASVGNSIVLENSQKNEETFNCLIFLNNWLIGFCTICLVCLLQPFMKLWMGEELMFNNAIVVLFGIYFFTWLIRRIGLTYKDAAGMWEDDFLKPYIGIIINVATNIILVKIIGVAGALISTILIMILVYFPWETHIIFKKIFKTKSINYIKCLLKFTIFTIIISVITYLLCKLINDINIATFIAKCIICLIVPNLLYFIVYKNNYEFNYSIKLLKKIIKK